MPAIQFNAPEVERAAINVVQGLWVVERARVLRTILGSCVSVCLYDPMSGIGGMNHFVYAPRQLSTRTAFSATTFCADICLEGLLEAVLKAGAQRGMLRAKAFGGGAMFEHEDPVISVGRSNARYALDWLEAQEIPVDLTDLQGACARRLHFHPASGQHLCVRLPTSFLPPITRGAAL